MKNINFKKSVMVCALSLGSISAANAATGTFDVGFRTITDVTITENQAISFGATLFSASGGVCDMLASAGTVDDTDLNIVRDVPITGGASTAGAVSGAGCIDTAVGASGNQLGIYTVAGIAGAAVKVTINEVLGAEFNYSPNQGCIGTYDGADDGDTCTSFFPGTTVNSSLLDIGNDTDPADGAASDGSLKIVLGGTVTLTADLASDTNYTQQFTIDATY
jgi:hypothetical protein